MNSMQMIHNEQGNPSLFYIMTHHHDQFHFFHRRREEKAKLSPPWDPTNFEPKLLTKSTHSFLPGNLSGVTSSSKTFNQDFSHRIVRACPLLTLSQLLWQLQTKVVHWFCLCTECANSCMLRPTTEGQHANCTLRLLVRPECWKCSGCNVVKI